MAIKVTVAAGGSFAPCMYYYRIVREDIHRAAMATVSMNGGPGEPDDPREDNVLLSYDDVAGIVPPRRLRELEEGWDVTFLLDEYEALTIYGYDCADTLAGHFSR